MQLHAGQLVEWCMSASRDGIVERCIEGDDTDAVMLRVQLAYRCPVALQWQASAGANNEDWRARNAFLVLTNHK